MSTPKRPKRCHGFGEHEGRCPEPAGPVNPIWCDRCDALRVAHVSRRLDELKAWLDEMANPTP